LRIHGRIRSGLAKGVESGAAKRKTGEWTPEKGVIDVLHRSTLKIDGPAPYRGPSLRPPRLCAPETEVRTDELRYVGEEKS
jgi:hypothetical protein